MYGAEPLKNDLYGHIINEKHFNRLSGLIDKNKVVFGGNTSQTDLKIEPTIMDNVTSSDAVMQEEIFGPILPFIEFDKIDEIYHVIENFESPLALYLFSNNKKIQNEILKRVSFGGGCINDTIIHIATSYMGFGGVGFSGHGSYHGKRSFDLFMDEKSVVKKIQLH